MDWDDLRYFLAVARKGSIRAAADVLAVNPSTVSRRIDALEKKLAVRLFERLTSGYVLTPIGDEMVDSAQRIEEEVGRLDRQVNGRDAQLSGVLRVTMPTVLSTHLLMPDLAAFATAYPGIQLELATSNEELDLKKREADVAIRLTANPPDYAVGRRVLTPAKCVYASERYIEQYDPVRHPEMMQWIGWDEADANPQWIKESGFPNTPVHHQSDDLHVQLEAAKAGMGLAMLPCFIGDSEPELQRLGMESTSTSCGDIWILTHKDLRNTARIRAFIDFMILALEKHRDLLEGKSIKHKPVFRKPNFLTEVLN